MKIAVVGSGISGLSCAYRLQQAGIATSLFEAGEYFGGHSNTVEVDVNGVRHGVDMGFLVFNHLSSPRLVALLAELEVDTADSEMGFSVRLPAGGRPLEWAHGGLGRVFCQRANLLRPAFLRMLRDIRRFRLAMAAMGVALAVAPARATDGAGPPSLGAYLDREGYSAPFRQWYLLPMAAGVWTGPARHVLDFPLDSFVHFCHQHGLLQAGAGQHGQWRTVRGGARQYVRKMLATLPDRRLLSPVLAVTRGPGGVTVRTARGLERFDEVVLACHSGQSLALLADASDEERAVLSAVRYRASRAVLHTDTSVLPAGRRAWAAVNHEGDGDGGVCVHYLLNKLQPMPFTKSFILSLDPLREPAPSSVVKQFDYALPVADAAAHAARGRLPALQGHNRAWFAGAWTGHGFHEDGLTSGLKAADAIVARARRPAPPALESA